jgi:hypothetical protein
MEHAADDFAILSEDHVTAAKYAASPEQRRMHLAIAHHYGQIALLKGGRQVNVPELHQSEMKNGGDQPVHRFSNSSFCTS